MTTSTGPRSLLDAQAPEPGPGELLQAEDLRVDFATSRGLVRAVDGVSLRIGRGESVGVVGESGSGKSAFALSLMGLLPDYANVTGSLSFAGREVLDLPRGEVQRLRGRSIGMVFQDPNASLNPVRTVGAQLVETLRMLLGMSRGQARARAVELLAQVGLPEPRRQLGAYPHELSGGMRQRVMIALALAGEPELLIADEATTALDVSVQAQILMLLREIIASRSMSMLIITHDLGVAASVADRIAVMYAGRLAEVGPAQAVFAQPQHPYTYALLQCIPSLDSDPGALLTSIEGQAPDPLERPSACAFAARCPLVHDRCVTEHPPLDRRQEHTGDPRHRAACWATQDASAEPVPVQLAALPARPSRSGDQERSPHAKDPRPEPGGTPLLELKQLQVRYRQRGNLFHCGARDMVAVRDISLQLQQGQTLGLVGESGSGKSSTARAVLRLEGGTSGQILFGGQDITALPERRMRRIRPHLQLIMQDITTSLSPRFSVEQAIAEPLSAHRVVPAGGRSAHIAGLLRDVALSPDLAARPARELSGGQRQRVNIARALATRPQLIVADEPTSALDVSVRAQILNLMKRLQREHDLAYLFISHDLTVVRQMSDRIAVMYLGKVVEVADRNQLFDRPQHPYTRALLAAIPMVGRASITPISGEQPSPISPPSGCPFRTRCPKAQSVCAEREPALDAVSPGQSVACFFPGDTAPGGESAGPGNGPEGRPGA